MLLLRKINDACLNSRQTYFQGVCIIIKPRGNLGVSKQIETLGSEAVYHPSTWLCRNRRGWHWCGLQWYKKPHAFEGTYTNCYICMKNTAWECFRTFQQHLKNGISLPQGRLLFCNAANTQYYKGMTWKMSSTHAYWSTGTKHRQTNLINVLHRLLKSFLCELKLTSPASGAKLAKLQLIKSNEVIM